MGSRGLDKFSSALFKLPESLLLSFSNASNLALRVSHSYFIFCKSLAWTELVSKAALSKTPKVDNSFFNLATMEDEPLESCTLNTLAKIRARICISKKAEAGSLVETTFIAPLSADESEILTPLWKVKSGAKS